nr:MAG: P8 protein [Yunnan emara-like virus]
MAETGISLESVLIELWLKLFHSMLEDVKQDNYDDLNSMKEELIETGEVKNHSMSGARSIFKFNKMIFLCTQIIDYNSVLFNKFKNHFEKFDIKLIDEEYGLRYRNEIAVARTINNIINYKYDLSDMAYWKKAMRILTNQLNQKINLTEANLIATCESQLKIIHKLDDIVKSISIEVEKYNDKIDEVIIDCTKNLEIADSRSNINEQYFT